MEVILLVDGTFSHPIYAHLDILERSVVEVLGAVVKILGTCTYYHPKSFQRDSLGRSVVEVRVGVERDYEGTCTWNHPRSSQKDSPER